MRESKEDKAVREAVDLLRQVSKVDKKYSFYLASGTLCLMKGPSHDKDGRPLHANVVDSAWSGLHMDGGDW